MSPESFRGVSPEIFGVGSIHELRVKFAGGCTDF